jgi:hypothetical protein
MSNYPGTTLPTTGEPTWRPPTITPATSQVRLFNAKYDMARAETLQQLANIKDHAKTLGLTGADFDRLRIEYTAQKQRLQEAARRTPTVALPPQHNVMAAPTYIPTATAPVRPGAEAAQRIPSRGARC